MPIIHHWRSTDGIDNSIALQSRFPDVFVAIAELDRLGHLVLHRAGSRTDPASLEEVVGIALLRRAVTVFASLRHLLEQSLPDPARALARAQFELWLNYRALAYGTLAHITLETPCVASERAHRAEYFFLASERRGLLSRALILHPNSPYRPAEATDRDALEKELAENVVRLRREFSAPWSWYGDTASDSLAVKEAVMRDRLWFEHLWPDGSVKSIRSLASAFEYDWEYDFTYDSFSALVHARGIRHDVEFDHAYCNVRHPYDDSWFQVVAYRALLWHGMVLMTAVKWQVPQMLADLQSFHSQHREAIKQLGAGALPPVLS